MPKINQLNIQKESFHQTIERLSFRAELALSNERHFFIENLSMLLGSGMTVYNATLSIASDIRGKAMQKILKELAENVSNGSPLWRAFQDAKIFPAHVVALVRIGEESGRLSENLKLVAVQEEKDRVFRSKIKSAMMYPVFIFTVTILVGVLIMWFILPRLATVFGQLRIELPALTKILISFGTFLGKYGFIAIPLFFVLVGIFIFFIFYYSKTKHLGQSFLFAFPGVGALLRQIEISRFSFLLGTLLSAGIPISNALDSVKRATTLPIYKNFYAHLENSIKEGNSFEKSFSAYYKTHKVLPKTIESLIVASEKSGVLSSTLLRISERYEAKIEDTTKNLAVIFEPILLVIVWVGVVLVALSVILPIYSLVGGLNN